MPVFTVSSEPLGNAFLHGNTAHVVPVQQQPTVPVPPPAPPPATGSKPEPAQKQQRRYVFIGKPRKVWGRLMSLPDPEPDQHQQKKGKAIARRGRRGKRTVFFVGSLGPLLLARRQKRRRRRSASLDANVDEERMRTGIQTTATGSGREFVVPTIVVTEPDGEPEMEMVGTRITPEEVERAISWCCFAIETAA